MRKWTFKFLGFEFLQIEEQFIPPDPWEPDTDTWETDGGAPEPEKKDWTQEELFPGWPRPWPDASDLLFPWKWL